MGLGVAFTAQGHDHVNEVGQVGGQLLARRGGPVQHGPGAFVLGSLDLGDEQNVFAGQVAKGPDQRNDDLRQLAVGLAAIWGLAQFFREAYFSDFYL